MLTKEAGSPRTLLDGRRQLERFQRLTHVGSFAYGPHQGQSDCESDTVVREEMDREWVEAGHGSIESGVLLCGRYSGVTDRGQLYKREQGRQYDFVDPASKMTFRNTCINSDQTYTIHTE